MSLRKPASTAAASAASDSATTDLMRRINSPGAFWDPMPPSQHAYFLDIDEPALNRAIGWVLSKTIRRGSGNRRSPYALDERGPLTHIHAAADLKMTISNARVLFQTLESQGRIRINSDGKIWLRGDVPAPRRIKGENKTEEICTYFLTPHFSLYLQQLDEKESHRRVAELQELENYEKRVLAEAVAAGRAAAAEVRNRWFEQIGYKPEEEHRGRPRLERESTAVQLSLLTFPDFVQISDADFVQKPEVDSGHKKNGSVRNSHPYGTEKERNRVSEWENGVPQNGATHPLPKTPSMKKSEVVELVEDMFGAFDPEDPLIDKYNRLAEEFEIPEQAIINAMGDKLREKARKSYHIESAGALFEFLAAGLPGWIFQHPRLIDQIRRDAQQPATVAAPPDTDTYSSEPLPPTDPVTSLRETVESQRRSLQDVSAQVAAADPHGEHWYDLVFQRNVMRSILKQQESALAGLEAAANASPVAVEAAREAGA